MTKGQSIWWQSDSWWSWSTVYNLYWLYSCMLLRNRLLTQPLVHV